MSGGSDSNMILLRANHEIKTVFLKMINTMGGDVKWTGIFVINNNDIILAGEDRSLFFNFDNKRSFSNMVDLPINEDKVKQFAQNALLVNALNMILYAFGKWGGIKGLKVEMDYDQLNRLINNILEEIDIESNLTKDNFRFYKDGVQMAYEEVIQAILDKSNAEDEGDIEKEDREKEDREKESEQKDDNEEELVKKQEEENNKYDLGLWHNICWIAGNFTFVKEELSKGDRDKARLGNDFYIVNYKCPVCGEKLYMVVYPAGKEFRIETGEEAVYMSRAYTCSTCNSYYTPKPHKLLIEGDIYSLNFEDDKEAYKDYLELLGRQGERTSNSNFNVYESEYNRKDQESPPPLEEICNDMDSMSVKDITKLKDKMDSGFYSQISVEEYNKKVDTVLRSRSHIKNKDEEKELKENNAPSRKSSKTVGKKKRHVSTKKMIIQHGKRSNSGNPERDNSIKKKNNIKKEQIHLDENAFLKKETPKQDGVLFNLPGADFASKALEGLKEILASLLKGEKDLFIGKVEKLSSKQLGNLKLIIQSEHGLEENEKKNYIDIIDRIINKEKEKELNQKVVSSKERTYTEILGIIDEIKNEDCIDSVKKEILESLMELLKKNGKKELEYIISHIPENVSKKQYNQFVEKLEQYKEINISLYKKNLDVKRDTIEKQEIANFIKQVNAKDRESLIDLYSKLKKQDFEEKNVNSYLENINGKIYAMDEAAIKRICPEPADITFDEGLQMYDEISSENFLPELKVNVLGMIDKRLKKLKMDECEQLVKKLCKDINWNEEDYPRIYFNDVRKMMKGATDDAKSIIIHNALNTYAVDRGKYEYPILICDTSYYKNGKAGFVLTPDHIYYNGFVSSGEMEVMNIENVSAGTGLFSKGIHVNHKNIGKVKVSKSLKSNRLIKSLAEALNDFVSYLKEKPESRNVSYLAKEKHTEKCCYRCGYFYKGGNVCPKCGSKFND